MNRARAAQACEHYHQACGVPCQLIDPQGKILEQLHVISPLSTPMEAGGVYRSLNGLTYWASPILLGGEIAGTLVAGPALMGESRRLAEMHLKHPDIPILSYDRVQSLSELLIVATQALSDQRFARRGDPSGVFLPEQVNPKQVRRSSSGNGEPVDGPGYPIEKERHLLELVEIGDKVGAQTVLNDILGAVFFANSAHQPMIQTRVIELVVLLSRAAIRGGADAQRIFGQNYACLNQIHSFRTIDEIAYWLSGLLVRFTGQVFNQDPAKHTTIIGQAKDYIKKNYMKPISLEEVAAQVYLSPTYFSRIFKEATGENFNLYVNRVRIEAAKKCLTSENSPLSDISILTGFEDQSYFSKVFKRMTGVTPNKYRESRGKVMSTNG